MLLELPNRLEWSRRPQELLCRAPHRIRVVHLMNYVGQIRRRSRWLPAASTHVLVGTDVPAIALRPGVASLVGKRRTDRQTGVNQRRSLLRSVIAIQHGVGRDLMGIGPNGSIPVRIIVTRPPASRPGA